MSESKKDIRCRLEAIATRCDQHLPMIVTTNDTGRTLKARLSEDRGEPLLRRLREHCEPVVFE